MSREPITLLLPPVPASFHVHAMTTEQFMLKLRDGDDLAAWSVRYGVPIQDGGLWAAVLISPEAKTWPDWERKLLHGTRRLLLANTLLQSGDVDSAGEEALYAASHVSRALLLRSGVFPLSRAELVGQTRDARYRKLSEILELLLFGTADARYLRQIIQYLKKLLVSLDKLEFKRRSKDLAMRGSPTKKKPAL